ncbi:MAG TPA: hypothetical protein VD704_00475 [Gaiellaceae bacterium]|nr:hypothetical protein [Gaiellaceae bacterium]
MDEARTVIRRLERIEALQSSQAPADALLAEVRQLLREGEAWLAAEHRASRSEPARGGSGRKTTDGARTALEDCRAALERGEVVPGTAAATTL